MTGPRVNLDPEADYSWTTRAACIGHQKLFFGPDEEHSDTRQRRQTAALALCADCPVLHDCRAYTRQLRPADGIWAGLTERQRGRTRKRRRPQEADWPATEGAA